MRRVFVLCALVGMLGSVGAMAATRGQPAAIESSGEPTDGDEPEAQTTGAQNQALAAANPTAPGDSANADAEDREPLAVVALGWEILAPGVLANGGMNPGESSQFAAQGLDVTFSAVADASEIETRLGRGGAAEDGADVALLSLPAFVASYERLQALSPQVFHVVAWSRGGDALVGDAELLRAPARGELKLSGQPGSSSTLLGLFVLDQAGVSASRVRVVSDDPGRRGLRAVRRRKSREIDARELVLSTAEATHLVPFVVVAPAGLIERRRADLVTFSKVWMQGAKTLESDPAAAARTLARQPGAPEAVDLIDALGWLRFADLGEAAQAAGLSGRGAVNLDILFHRTWDLWREVGLLTTPRPEAIPLNATVIAELARAQSPQPAAALRSRRSNDADILLTHVLQGRRLQPNDEPALVAEIGLLAGVFSRSAIEVWIPRSPEAANRIRHHAVQRFALDEDRITVNDHRDRRARVAATITIHAPQ